MNYRKKHIHPKIRNLRHRKRLIKRPLFWIILCVISIVAATAYFTLFFPKFQVQSIHVTGDNQLQKIDIERMVWEHVHRKLFLGASSKSIFLVNSEELISDIMDSYSAVDSVRVERIFPHNVSLDITERKPFAWFCPKETTLELCFFLDRNGVVFEKSGIVDDDMSIVRQDNDDIIFGKSVVDKNVINSIAKIEENLQTSFNIGTKEAFISSSMLNPPSAENPLIITTSEKWKLYFDPASDIDLQIIKMNALLKDEISAGERKNLQYIYLQYKDRAYYK